MGDISMTSSLLYLPAPVKSLRSVTPTIVTRMRYYTAMQRGALKINLLWLIVITMNMRKRDHRKRLWDVLER
jgi:hypothetical protein